MFCKHVIRPYTNEEVKRLQGSLQIEYTLAKTGALKLRELLQSNTYINALGTLNGNQAIQMAKAGLKALYLSGWQIAGMQNTAGQMYPDQSLYPCNSVPDAVKNINNALRRADQIQTSEGKSDTNYFLPIIADAEAGFGGALNAFELMKAMIEAGASAVHFEDQLASEKKCGHLGGKVLIPTSCFIKTLVAARLAADTLNVPTVLIARTDAFSASHINSDVDTSDHAYMDLNNRTPEGFYPWKQGIDGAIARGLAYAPYADLLWMETSEPSIEQAKQFAEAIHAKFPGKQLAYNCSPSFNWKKKLSQEEINTFQKQLGDLGYSFQFITLFSFHAINHTTFEYAREYSTDGMKAYSKLQEAEFASEKDGYTAIKHQREVGTGYFDVVGEIISGGKRSIGAMGDSTESEQFH